MDKHTLQTQLKSTGNAYLFWFLLGAHYAYLGRWGLQILYWITFGGIGIWALVDLFSMASKVENHNRPIIAQLQQLEKAEKDADQRRHMEMLAAVAGKASV